MNVREIQAVYLRQPGGHFSIDIRAAGPAVAGRGEAPGVASPVKRERPRPVAA